MGVLDVMYRTGAAIADQGAQMVGIKGGKNGWLQMNEGGPGFMKAFQNDGFVGMGSQMKSFFGVGFSAQGRMEGMGRYLKTVAGHEAFTTLPSGRRPVSRSQYTKRLWDTRRFGKEAAATFGRRRIAGGVAGGAGLMAAGQFVGYGNMMKMGAGWGIGSVLGGAISAPFGARAANSFKTVGGVAQIGASRAGYGAAGRRWGGRMGLAATGLGVMTGII